MLAMYSTTVHHLLVLQDEWPLLVIVPASLRLVWAEEIERWLSHVRPGSITVIEGKEDRLCDLPDQQRAVELPAVTITSFEMMKRLSCEACQKGASVAGSSDAGRRHGGGGGIRGAAAAGRGAHSCTACRGPGNLMESVYETCLVIRTTCTYTVAATGVVTST